jgi:hypothetical protein
MSRQPMHDDRDPVIWRLFAGQDHSLPSEDFVRSLGRRMDRLQRAQRVHRSLAIVAFLLLSAIGAPWLAETTSSLIDFSVLGIGQIGPLLHMPMTWVVVSAIVGCSPVIYLWRTGQW